MDAFQQLRLHRVMSIRQRSSEMRHVFGMPDGLGQEERDMQISWGTYEGSPIALADPVYQKWLWGYDASQEAEAFLHRVKA